MKRLPGSAKRALARLGGTMPRTSNALPTAYASKPYALVHSEFDEILVLDADNTPIRNPDYLFASNAYEETGAVFWPDFDWAPANEAWSQLAQLDNPPKTRQQESGQLLIHKARCEHALAKTLEFNQRYEDIKSLLWGAGGDKDTFQLAWYATQTPFHMIPFYPGSAGRLENGNYKSNTMIQHDLDGNPLFMHKNAHKWHLVRKESRSWDHCIFAINPSGEDITFKMNSHSAGHTHELLPKENTREVAAEKVIADLEEDCLDWIHRLRKMGWYRRSILQFYLRDYSRRFIRTT